MSAGLEPPRLSGATVPADRLGRVVNVDAAVRRYGAEAIEPLLDGMLTGDDLALAVVEDFRRVRGGPAMYRRAVEQGIEAVPEAPESMRRLFAAMESVPGWVDWEQLRRGS